jgi:hypothetical protein
MIAEYLYHDGQIEAADVMCKARVWLWSAVLAQPESSNNIDTTLRA